MCPFSIKKRHCRAFDGATYFKPCKRGVPLSELEINELALDEMEAIHLCDHDGLNQSEAAEKMKISSSTLQRLLYAGRKKIIDALYTGKAIKILKPDQVTEYVDQEYRCHRRGRQNRQHCTNKRRNQS